jgi:hypothetical protein
MSNSNIVEINAHALALALRIRAAGGSFETTHEVDGRKITVTRGPGGQFASPGGGEQSATNTTKSQLQEFGSNLSKKLKLQEAADKISQIPKDAQAGFNRLLTDNPLTKAISSQLDGATKAGFDAGNNLISSLKGMDWKKIPKQFADGVGGLVKDLKENPTDYLIGVGAIAATTFGVACALSAGSLAVALPGAIGAAMETGDMTALGLHLAQLSGKSVWAIIATVIVVPLIGQMVIAKAISSPEKEKTPEQIKAEEVHAKEKAERVQKLALAVARQAEWKKEDPTTRKMRFMGVDTDALQELQKKLKAQSEDATIDEASRRKAIDAIQKLREEISNAEKAWTAYMDSAGTDLPYDVQVKLQQELARHVSQVKQLIDQM